jgi:hypothetical protein
MDRTLDQIEHELSPGKLLDRSKEFVREHGGDFVREAGTVVRENPIPVLLTAAGVVWLTAVMARPRAGSHTHSRDTQSRGNRNGGALHLDEDMESFEDFAAGHGGSSGGSSDGPALSQPVRRMQSHLTRLVREQPIALGALALAAGALLGAALPMTEYENNVLGTSGRKRSSPGDSVGEQSRQSAAAAASTDTPANDPAMIDE